LVHEIGTRGPAAPPCDFWCPLAKVEVLSVNFSNKAYKKNFTEANKDSEQSILRIEDLFVFNITATNGRSDYRMHPLPSNEK